MFVKVIRREKKENTSNNHSEAAYYCCDSNNRVLHLFDYGCVSIFECKSAHFRHKEERQAIISLEPLNIDIHIQYDAQGKGNVQLYYMNNEGHTIEKVVL